MTDFTDEFLDALDDWLIDTTDFKPEKGARLAAAALTAPARCRAFEGVVYRRIDLKQEFVALFGAYLVLDETTSSWTKALDVAKRHDKLRAPPKSAFIFARRLAPAEVVLDIEALNHDPDFQAAQKAFGYGRGGFDYMRREAEVLARVDRIHLNDVVTLGTRSPDHGPTWLSQSGARDTLRRWLKAVDPVLAKDALRDGEVVGGWGVDGRTLIDLRPAGAKYPVITEIEGAGLVCREGLRLALWDGVPAELSREEACAALARAGVSLSDVNAPATGGEP